MACKTPYRQNAATIRTDSRNNHGLHNTADRMQQQSEQTAATNMACTTPCRQCNIIEDIVGTDSRNNNILHYTAQRVQQNSVHKQKKQSQLA